MAKRKSTHKASKEPIPYEPFTPYNSVAVDLTDQIFGRLTALGVAGYRDENAGQRLWVCRCSCGIYKVVRGTALTAPAPRATRSCGCLSRETSAANPMCGQVTHGRSNTPIYRVYHTMRARCERTTDGNYHRYGGRGIKVCDRWSGENGFENFYADMGDPPFKGASLERKDNNGPYSPDNVVWAGRRQQGRNKRNNRYVDYRGEHVLLRALTERFGLPYKVVHNRIMSRGWSVERAIEQPLRGRLEE